MPYRVVAFGATARGVLCREVEQRHVGLSVAAIMDPLREAAIVQLLQRILGIETLAWSGGTDWLQPLGTLPHRVVATLLLTDIVDSTGAARRLGDRNWAEIVEHFQLGTREILGRHGGRLIDFAGDGVFAAFDAAGRAVRCAISLSRAAAELGLELRAAVHTGEVELAGEAVRGLAVHEAARILGLAGGAEVLVSETTAALASDPTLSFEERREHELRGVPGRRRLFCANCEPSHDRTDAQSSD